MTAKLLIQIQWNEPATRWLVDLLTLRKLVQQNAQFCVREVTAEEMPRVIVSVEERAEESPLVLVEA